MPILFDIIAVKRKMDESASKFYREIENWYQIDDSGYTVREPMNIPARNVGKSARTLQSCSFLLARAYFEFLSGGLSKDDIKESQEFFSSNFISDKDLKESPAKVSFIPVVDQFYPDLKKFITSVQELCSMRDAYTPDYTNDMADLKLLMQDYINTLLTEYGYTTSVIKKACNNVMATMPLTTEEPELSLESVWSMDKDFYRLQSRSVNYSISDESVYVKPNDSEEMQVKKLSKFLSTHLPHVEWLNLFADITCSNKEGKKWHADSFWSSGQSVPQTFVTTVENAARI